RRCFGFNGNRSISLRSYLQRQRIALFFDNLEEFIMYNLIGRDFAKLSTTIAAIALGFVLAITVLGATETDKSAMPLNAHSSPTPDDRLQSEFLLDLQLEAQT